MLVAADARAEGGRFGAGLSVGSPTGVSLKLYLDSARSSALDLGLGAALLGAQGFQAHVDYLINHWPISDEDSFRLAAYVGAGARILQHAKENDQTDVHFGARGVGGVVFVFERVPLDAFLEDLRNRFPDASPPAQGPQAAAPGGSRR